MSYNWFAYEILLRLQDLIKGADLRQQMDLVKALTYGSRDEIEQYQFCKLKELVVYACENIPYYQDWAKNNGFSPGSIRSLRDLPLMPILSRNALIRQLNKFKSPSVKHRRVGMGFSGGSTGCVLRYYKDRYASELHRAAQYVGYGFSGWEPGARTCTIWGNRRTVEKEWIRPSSKIKQRLLRNLRIPAFLLQDITGVNNVLDEIRRFHPDYLEGYSGAIACLAEEALRQKMMIPVKGVLTTAETLLSSWKEKIEKAFGRVYDGYGCGEILAVAYQCEQGLYHIMEPSVIVEYEPLGNDGECALLLTDLHNQVMPIIRYRVGDIAVPSERPCPCGRAFKTMERIVGRTSDVIKTKSGGQLVIPSFFGSSAIDIIHQLGIKQYQVALLRDYAITVRIVPGQRMQKDMEQRLLNEINLHLGHELDVCVEIVSSIASQPNGKHKLVVDER